MSSQTTGIYWHSRGYLPHFEGGEIPQAITFRLGDSLPAAALERMQTELRLLPATQATLERRRRIEELLDHGAGEQHLADPRVAAVVETALLHFDMSRYRLHAWCIMPNHVHVLIRDGHHFANAVSYIALNPVKARLCATPGEWRFSSSWDGRCFGRG
jgi:hypothetical protein